MEGALASPESDKIGRKIERLMEGYTSSYKSELLGYNLVTKGICTIKDLWETMDYEDVMKLTEALLIQGKIESFMMMGGK